MRQKKQLAIIGAGISGLGCAYYLKENPHIEITIFEKESRLGGHSNTIDFLEPGGNRTYGIDTGFLVFNRRTYPRLLQLFKELDVPIADSEMSFSVSIPTNGNSSPLEWAGTDLNSIFAQRHNLWNFDFLGMLKDIIRFNKLAKAIARNNELTDFTDKAQESVEEFLVKHKFGSPFKNWYLLPMIGAIWSCPVSEMMQFPIKTLIHFCDNHGLLNIIDRPQWLTVDGGSREYVSRLVNKLKNSGIKIDHKAISQVDRTLNAEKITLTCDSGEQLEFDEVVFACHSDETIKILKDASKEEQMILSSIPYQKNTAYLHTDESLLPKNKKAWAAWNYSSKALGSNGNDVASHVCVHYLINKLQPLPDYLKNQSIIVSLNPHTLPKESLTQRVIHYSHPLFDGAAIHSQKQLPLIQGKNNTWYCGAWTGYGFHEDGLKSGELVAMDILESINSEISSESFPSEKI